MDKMKLEEIRERLSEFYNSREGQITVRELLTSSSNIVLPQMVQAKVLFVMKSWTDFRDFALRQVVPRGAGKVVNVQIATSVEYDSWSEGSAPTAVDPSLAARQITLVPFGKNTLISDLLANTSAINFVETIGQIHADAIRTGIIDKIVDEMAGASAPNAVSIGTKGDSTERNFDFSNVASAISAVLSSGFLPNFIATAPDKLWAAFTTNYSVTQFTGALSDFLVSGQIPKVLGLNWYMDPYFEKAITGSSWSGSNGEKYAIIGQEGMSVVWAALQDEPVVEIWREGRALSNYVVTHMDGGASEGPDASICLIKHAE
jgi:hypothetical protein